MKVKNITLSLLLMGLCGCADSSGLVPTVHPMDANHLQTGSKISAIAASRAPIYQRLWWRRYGDNQLNQLVETAIKGSPSITAAAASIRRAIALSETVSADNLPAVTGAMSATHERFPDHYVYPSPYAGNYDSEASLRLNLNYSLDFWGKRKETLAAAKQNIAAAEAQARDAALLLQTAIVTTYIQLNTAYALQDLTQQVIIEHQRMMVAFRERTQAGLSTDIDDIQTKEALTEAQGEAARLESEINKQKNKLAALVGKDIAFADTIRRPLLKHVDDPTFISTIPATLLGYRPDVAAARMDVEIAAHSIRAAQAAFYPDVNLVAFAGVASLGLDYLLRSGSTAIGVGPAVTLPLFDGGKLRANLKVQNSNYDLAVSRYNMAVVSALQQVADGIADLKAENIRQRKAVQVVSHWQHVASLQKLRVAEGLSGVLDQSQAKLSLLLAKKKMAEANTRVNLSQVALIHALGGAWAPTSYTNTKK